MTKEDKNPDEQEQELEENLESEEEEVEPDDPLDLIEDEEARKKAKKERAILQRKARKSQEEDEEEEPEPKPEPKSDDAPLSRKEFYKGNEKKAKALLAESHPDVDVDKVVEYYSPRRGKATPEDIVEDLLDAHAIYQRNNPNEEGNDVEEKRTRAEIASHRTKGGSSPDSKTHDKPRKKILTKGADMTEWYPKKEE